MGTPPWWNALMPELVNKRDLMQNVEKWQTMYVRYKCQPEAQVTQTGWDLAISQRYADQLALEEQQPYLSEESLLYNGLAPTNIALRIVEAPAEFAVPVKQDRRLTPNFKVRVDVSFKGRCSFPLTLKAYIITQQEKDSVPEWVPDDFLDPDLPQRKPVTELKGTTVITHHFEGSSAASPKQGGAAQKQGFGGLDAATAQALLGKAADPSLLASLGWTGDLDPRMVKQMLQESARGNVDPAAAAALAAAAQMGADALTSALGGSAAAAAAAAAAAGANAAPDGHLSHDYEFSSVELVKPTRMNKVYLVFACSILEQDLMFVVYNIPTVGICRAEQRQKACQKLGISYSELGGQDLYQQEVSQMSMGGGSQLRGMPPGVATMAAMQQQAAAAAHASHQRKRGSAAQNWDSMMIAGGDGMAAHRAFAGQEGLLGMAGSDLSGFAGDPMGMGAAMTAMAMQVDGLMPGLAGDAGLGMGMAGISGIVGAPGLPAMQPSSGAPAAAAGVSAPEARTRTALRELLTEEYDGTGLHRKLTVLDLQALESQAGFPVDSSNKAVSISEQQWQEFVCQYRAVLRLLRQISLVWNLEDPCVIAGFDMDRLGTVQALSLEPAGTFICRFSMSQPGCLVLSCRVAPGHPNADADGLLHAIIKTDDLYERRVETWIRDFPGATHILDVYSNKRVDKRKVFASNYTRLRAMNVLDAYDDILI